MFWPAMVLVVLALICTGLSIRGTLPLWIAVGLLGVWSLLMTVPHRM